MSYRDPGDPRAHTMPDEKMRHAQTLVAQVKSMICEDQDTDVPACNECAVVTLLLAIGVLCEEIGDGPYVDEMMGSARRLIHVQEAFDKTAAGLVARAAEIDPAYALRQLTRNPADYGEIAKAA